MVLPSALDSRVCQPFFFFFVVCVLAKLNRMSVSVSRVSGGVSPPFSLKVNSLIAVTMFVKP